MRKIYRSLLVVGVALTTNVAVAQFAPEVVQYEEKYPNAHSVTLQHETSLEISLNKGRLAVRQEIMEEELYLDDAATQNSKRSLTFSSFFEMEAVEASSFVYDKDKYREIKVTEFKEKDELENSFHDDTKSVNFIFPDLRKGSKTLLRYSEKIVNPRFLTPFYFGDYAPILHNKFSITVDKDINIRFLQFNTEDIDIRFTEEEKRGKKIYTWETGEVAQYFPESGSPSYKKILPHIIPVVSSYKVNGTEVDVLKDVSDLYGWYSSLVRGLNQGEDDPEMVQLVEELTAGKENELEKVRAIYYWTQKNIKYIAFEYALGGFVPREANYVYKNKYGDCKDNSSILQKMLSIAGIKGNLTWIGTRSIPYTYREVPTPVVDNHMILAYENGDQIYYLDATGRYNPLELPSSFIQGKEALIAAENGGFRIETVPVVPAKENAFVEVSTLEIGEDRIIGESRTEVTGYNKMTLYGTLERTSGETKLKEYYNSLFTKGNNKFLIREYSEENKFDYDKPFVLTYTFDIRDYAQRIGEEIYLNLNMNRDLENYRTAKDRKNETEFEYNQHFGYTTVLKIPEGYEVEYLPESVEFENDHLTASITYSLEGDKIIYTHNVMMNSLVLDLEDQKEVNELVEKAERAYKEVVILKNKKTS